MPPSPAPPSRAARLLGAAGLVPFVTAALALWLLAPAWRAAAALVLSAYAATIVSFLGGIHWGLAARRLPGTPSADGLLAWGVMPSLAAWCALLLPPAPGLVVLAVALVVCYAVDTRAFPREGLAGWLPMRLRLTVVAAISCLAGAAALWNS
jgi:hypothetical protein